METVPMLLIPALLTLAPVLIVALVLRYQRTRAEMRYRLLLQLAEAGAALPPSLPGEATPQHCDRRRGLVLIAGGLGLSLTLLALPLQFPAGQSLGSLWGLGLLPGVLGLGYLGNWFLTRRGGGRG